MTRLLPDLLPLLADAGDTIARWLGNTIVGIAVQLMMSWAGGQ